MDDPESLTRTAPSMGSTLAARRRRLLLVHWGLLVVAILDSVVAIVLNHRGSPSAWLPGVILMVVVVLNIAVGSRRDHLRRQPAP